MSYNPFALNGKRILITGASSGIGRATAIEASKLGASIIITGRNESRLKETLEEIESVDKSAIITDFDYIDQITKLVDEIPPINGLVISFGIQDGTPISFVNEKKLTKVFKTNFFAPAELIKLLLKAKKLSKDSSIVAVASIGGISKISYANGIYGASKAALASWMKFVALELAQKGIRANCVCPGMTNTPFIQSGVVTQEQLIKDQQLYPLHRYGEPIEIAWSIIYLLSDASNWVTGTNLFIDGGLSI